MKELQELRNEVLSLRNMGELTKQTESILLHKLNTLQEAINFIQCCDKLPQDPAVLARYLHEAYEMIAKKQNWNTQENCKVDFSDLPIGNKNTMILLAGKLILDFGGN